MTQTARDPAEAGTEEQAAPGVPRPAAADSGAVKVLPPDAGRPAPIPTGFPEPVPPDEPRPPAPDGMVRLAPVGFGSLTVPPLEDGGESVVITADGTDVDAGTARRAHAAARLAGFRLREF